MASVTIPDGLPERIRRRRRPLHVALRLGVFAAILYLLAAYLVAPVGWRRFARRHPALDDVPSVTYTAIGIPGDPLNVALVASEADLHLSMLAAGWFPADPVTFRSSVRIAADSVLHRKYDDAPVSSLFLWNHKQDFAFERAAGKDPRRRHHVRFWRSETLDDASRPLWMGAATFDTKVGFSHRTGQITHHIDPNIDAERDELIDDLKRAGDLANLYWIDGFQPKLEGKNGGGDPWHTDGRLAVGVLAVDKKPPGLP